MSDTPHLETRAHLRSLPYADYLKTHHWKVISRAARDHYGDACIFCGAASDTHVHHRSYKRLGEERIGDLTVLCAECHGRFHGHTDDDIGETRTSVIDALQVGESQSAREIAVGWGLSEKQVKRCLHELELEGVAARVTGPRRSTRWVLIHAHFSRLINEEAA